MASGPAARTIWRLADNWPKPLGNSKFEIRNPNRRAETEAFRQARPLAEGQKSADVKHDFIVPPPLRQPRQLAEGVEFPEKNAGSRVFEPSFGGGGPRVGSAIRLMAIFNHATKALSAEP